jgi:hypothetical protein
MPEFKDAVRFGKIPVVGLVAEAGGSAPSSPAEGSQWTDTTNHFWKFWNGSAWKNPLARADHTGTQLANTISDFDTAVRTSRLDQMTAPTASVNFNSQRGINVADPVSGTDLANKQYVDNARAGLAGVKDPVKAVSLVNINIASLPSTIDSISFSNGDRFLAQNQTTATENGIYTYTSTGGAGARSIDADGTSEILDGTLVAVSQGTDAGSQYIQTATPTGAPGSWTQTWVKYSTGGQTYLAGDGLNLSSNTFSVVAADGSVSVSGSGVTVGLVPISKGGTNATTAAAARTNIGAVGKYAADVGTITGGTPVTITHSLGTKDVSVTVRDTATDEEVWCTVKHTATNDITLTFAASASAGAYRVVVIG